MRGDQGTAVRVSSGQAGRNHPNAMQQEIDSNIVDRFTLAHLPTQFVMILRVWGMCGQSVVTRISAKVRTMAMSTALVTATAGTPRGRVATGAGASLTRPV